MAIYNGPMASKMRGKIGEIVAAKTVGGQTALRAYQPKVKNPNTKRQQNSRTRFGIASKLAATLGEAISIGYAMASRGMKMYPRNLFARDIVPLGDNPVIEFNGNDYVVNYSSVKVSKSAGLADVPVVGAPDFGEAGKVTVGVTVNEPAFDLRGGSIGIVVVVLIPDKDVSIVKQAIGDIGSSVNVMIDGLDAYSGAAAYVYVFSKVVPASLNDIQTEAMPWKYPSETSATVYVGTGSLQ